MPETRLLDGDRLLMPLSGVSVQPPVLDGPGLPAMRPFGMTLGTVRRIVQCTCGCHEESVYDPVSQVRVAVEPPEATNA